MNNYFKEHWKNIYLTLLLNSRFFSRIFSIYIPSLALSISLSSLFFFMSGFLFPNIRSLLLAALVDVFVCLVKSPFSFNIFFFCQPIFLSGIGWFIRFLFQTQNTKLIQNLFIVVNIFGILLSVFLDYHIFYHVLFIVLMWFIWGNNSKNSLLILLTLSISAYLVSFLLGINGAVLVVNSDLTSLLFKTRVQKEIIKNFFLFFILDLFLRKYEFN